MKEEGSRFKFKQFSISHSRCSMKVGIDGVLIGAWGDISGQLGLDAGCGCGLIALMAAQRNTEAQILAVDIHKESAEEAASNFSDSPWPERLRTLHRDINEMKDKDNYREKFDFIISNPPFFSSGLIPASDREIARHEGSLSPRVLLEVSGSMLKPEGKLSMIMPASNLWEIEGHPIMRIKRLRPVTDRPGKNPKRLLVSLEKCNGTALKQMQFHFEPTLFIRQENGEYSDEYKKLTKEFYLYF